MSDKKAIGFDKASGPDKSFFVEVTMNKLGGFEVTKALCGREADQAFKDLNPAITIPGTMDKRP